MPFIIRDSSSITQRKRDKAISGSFINRIQNSKNPTTGSAPLLGISEDSIINTVKTGQMTQYERNYGCVFVSPGCPCNTVIPVIPDIPVIPVIPDIGWATRISGLISDGRGIAANATDVYVTGYFGNTATIYNTPGTIESGYTLTSLSQDTFIVKYNTAGTALWATKIGGTLVGIGWAITTDATGVYVTGSFNGDATIYNTPGNISSGFTLTTSGPADIFIVKYNTDGTAQWATKISGTGSDTGYGIATDVTSVYVTGIFNGDATIYNTPGNVLSGLSLPTSGSGDIFVVKYDKDGTAQWATKIGGTGFDRGYAIATDATGVYVTGEFNGTAIIYNTGVSPGYVPISSGYTLTASGSQQDTFIVKYNTAGIALWATKIGGTSTDRGYAIATNATGVYVTGEFNGTATIYNTPGDISSGFTLSSGTQNAFIVKYNKDGYCVQVN